MSWNVDKAHHTAIGPFRICKAEINTETAALFLGKAVGVDSSQGANEGCLPMAHMSRGSDKHASISFLWRGAPNHMRERLAETDGNRTHHPPKAGLWF